MAVDNAAQVDNLVSLLDGYATKGGHHLNVNADTRAAGRCYLSYIPRGNLI